MRSLVASLGHILLQKALALLPCRYPIFGVYDCLLSRAGYLIAARSPSNSVLPRMHACINGNLHGMYISLVREQEMTATEGASTTFPTFGWFSTRLGEEMTAKK